MTEQVFVFVGDGQLSVSIPVLITPPACSRSFQLIWFPRDNVAIYLGVEGGGASSTSHCWFRICCQNTFRQNGIHRHEVAALQE